MNFLQTYKHYYPYLNESPDKGGTSIEDLEDDAENVTGVIIFKDKEVERIFREDLLDDWKEGTPFRVEEAEEISEDDDQFPFTWSNTWSENEKITSFDELKYFKNLSEIEENAFFKCRKLESISIPENVKVIRSRAFYKSGLKHITFFTNKLRDIDDYAFACTNLETITIPEGVEEIGSCAFCNCPNLREVRLPSTIKRIYDYAFADCPNLISVIGFEQIPPTTKGYYGGIVNAFGEGIFANSKYKSSVYPAYTVNDETIWEGKWFDYWREDVKKRWIEWFKETSDDWENDERNPQSECFNEMYFDECLIHCVNDDALDEWKNLESVAKRNDFASCYYDTDDNEFSSDLETAITRCIYDQKDDWDFDISIENGVLIVDGAYIYPLHVSEDELSEIYDWDEDDISSFLFSTRFTDKFWK